MTIAPVEPRWLFIVHAGETALFERLAQRLAGLARVVLDRRTGPPRRQRRVTGATDRRRGSDRRCRQSARVTPALGMRYHLVYGSAHVDLYEVDAPGVPAVCQECEMVLAFDMPHFAQPPARVELVVHHTLGRETAAHAVEVHATGMRNQSLLACQLEASPYTWPIEGIPDDA
jgi:hypothetical protein